MTQLVDASPVTWAAVHNVVWYGTVPGYELAQAPSKSTGFPVDAIMRASLKARDERRCLAEHSDEAAE